jgi:hypothetical protein
MGALEGAIRRWVVKQVYIPNRNIILRTVLAKAPKRTTMKGGMALLVGTP